MEPGQKSLPTGKLHSTLEPIRRLFLPCNPANLLWDHRAPPITHPWKNPAKRPCLIRKHPILEPTSDLAGQLSPAHQLPALWSLHYLSVAWTLRPLRQPWPTSGPWQRTCPKVDLPYSNCCSYQLQTLAIGLPELQRPVSCPCSNSELI